MKKSELKEYIKGRIRELVTVDVTQDTSQLTPTQKRGFIQNLRTKERNTKIGSQDNPVEFIEEDNVTELARPAEEFTIAADFRDRAGNIQTGGPISPAKLNGILDILDAMLADGTNTTTFSRIAQEYGLEMRRLYPVLAALRDAGVFTSTATPEDNEEEIEGGYEADDEGDFEGDVEVSDTAAEDIPDFKPEPEPEAASFEKAQVTLDPIAQAANAFTIDNTDLIQSLIRTYKTSKTRISEVRDENEGELSASDYKKALQQSKVASVEILNRKIEELLSKIRRLDPEVQDAVLNVLDFKFKSVNANKLFDLIAKKLGKTIEPSQQENPEDEILDMGDEEIMEDSGVEDVDHDGSSFKDYDSIYERMRKLVTYKG